MRFRRSFFHFGLAVAATLAVSPAGAAAYHGSARGDGTVSARDDAARTFTSVRRKVTRTYHVTDNTRYLVGSGQGSWWDLRAGAVVAVKWRNVRGQRVAEVVRIRPPSGK